MKALNGYDEKTYAFDNELPKVVADQMVREAGADLMLHTYVTDALMQGSSTSGGSSKELENPLKHGDRIKNVERQPVLVRSFAEDRDVISCMNPIPSGTQDVESWATPNAPRTMKPREGRRESRMKQ